VNAFIRGIFIAIRAIVRSPMRASLTILGILIGVAAVVTVTALGSGARSSVASQIESMGSNVIMIAPQTSQASGARSALGAGARLTEDDAKAIQREAVSVASVAPMLRARGQVVVGDKNWSTQLIGSTLAFYQVRNWKVERGTAWTERDEQTKAKVCVLGVSVAKNLFGDEDPIGKSIRSGRYTYRVLGVLEKKGEAPFGGDQDDMVLFPLSTTRARIIHTGPGFVAMMLVSATSADTTDRAVKQVEGILKQRHHIEEGREPDFWIRTQKEFQQMQSTIYGLLTVLLVCIAAVSLVVGGIGVMNIMLVSVTERTKEIGIRMAIGAREGDIRTQFLVEAVVLASVGGLAGMAVGIAAIAGLGALLEWPMKLDPVALFVAVFVSAMTGVVFGFFPARRASRLDPIEALRHE
jgi:putative ABC transport system permease protein